MLQLAINILCYQRTIFDVHGVTGSSPVLSTIKSLEISMVSRLFLFAVFLNC